MDKDTIIKNIYYDRAGYGSIQKTYKEAQDKESSIIRKQFNNAVIIIDEAHEMRESGKDKAVPPILMKVLKYPLASYCLNLSFL